MTPVRATGIPDEKRGSFSYEKRGLCVPEPDVDPVAVGIDPFLRGFLFRRAVGDVGHDRGDIPGPLEPVRCRSLRIVGREIRRARVTMSSVSP